MFSGQIEFDPVHKCESVSEGVSEGLTHANLTCCINQHLSIRSLTLKDTDALFSLTDANRSYLRQWLPWLDSNLSLEDTRAFIERGLEHARLGQEFVSAICYDRAIVGLVGLHDIRWHNRSSSHGYWLSATYQGRGLMTRACQSIIDYGFATLNLNRIDICCAVDNYRSEAVAKRLGLTYEGTLREAEWLYDHFVDWKVHSILFCEWKARLK